MKGFFNPQSIPKEQRSNGRSSGVEAPGPFRASASSRDRVVWEATSSKRLREAHRRYLYLLNIWLQAGDAARLFQLLFWEQGVWEKLPQPPRVGELPKDRQNCSRTTPQTLSSFMQKIVDQAGGSTTSCKAKFSFTQLKSWVAFFFSYNSNKTFHFLKLPRYPEKLSLFKSLLILSKPFSPD